MHTFLVDFNYVSDPTDLLSETTGKSCFVTLVIDYECVVSIILSIFFVYYSDDIGNIGDPEFLWRLILLNYWFN